MRRGDALRILHEHGDLDLAPLSKIRRQQGEYREIVEHLAERQVEAALAKLDARGSIRELPTEECHAFLAREYLAALDRGQTALVISPTHAEGRKVSEEIRRQLRERGRLHDERMFRTLRRIDMHDVEKENPALYREGWVIELTANSKYGRSGDRLIVESNQGEMLVRAPTGRVMAFDPKAAGDRFSVYFVDEMPIGIGDRLAVTRNGHDTQGRSLTNGSNFIVTGFSPGGDIVVDGGRTIAARYGHFGWGHVSTSFASQGRTVDRVFIAQRAESFAATNDAQMYVSASRGRQDVLIVTDDRTGLLDAAIRADERRAAVELERSPLHEPLPLSAHLKIESMTRLLWRTHERDQQTSPPELPGP